MSQEPKILTFSLYDPQDISDAFRLVCLRMGLRIKNEEDKCYKGVEEKVTYHILLKLAERYGLKVHIEFSADTFTIEYTPKKGKDEKAVEDVLKEEAERRRKLSDKMLKDMAKDKKKVEVSDKDIVTEPTDTGSMELDDLEFDLEEE